MDADGGEVGFPRLRRPGFAAAAQGVARARQGVPLGGTVPSPEDFEEAIDRVAAEKALGYMALEAGTPMREVKVDTVFIGGTASVAQAAPTGPMHPGVQTVTGYGISTIDSILLAITEVQAASSTSSVSPLRGASPTVTTLPVRFVPMTGKPPP